MVTILFFVIPLSRGNLSLGGIRSSFFVMPHLVLNRRFKVNIISPIYIKDSSENSIPVKLPLIWSQIGYEQFENLMK